MAHHFVKILYYKESYYHSFRWLIRFTTTFTITSFSSVRLSAIISVRATRVLSAKRLVPSGRYRTPLLFNLPPAPTGEARPTGRDGDGRSQHSLSPGILSESCWPICGIVRHAGFLHDNPRR